MNICGVDEAGKGSVLGPMVTAGVLTDSNEPLNIPGLSDSKKLTPKKRGELFEVITSSWKYFTVIKTPEEIDLRYGTMNDLTALCHAEVIRNLLPKVAYVDACDVNAARFGENVLRLSGIDVKIISEHKADAKFPMVSAASIVAKVTRDRLVEDLASEFGSIGSGYPSDSVTIKFLTDYISEYGVPPLCARKTWQTIDDIIAKSSQKNLSEFF